MRVRWENVYVFISSTFDDMHAERDELVKRVFPRLQDWCEQRKLRLVDIDLRWGVTEADATGRNVVKVCLDFIDRCRPFFLCFLGQRYGWVPRRAVSPDTFDRYPDLEPALDRDTSVTEIEVRHALLSPFSKKGQDERPSPAEYSFFYFREPDYLLTLPGDPERLPLTYVDLKRLPRDRQDLLRIYNELDPAADQRKLTVYLEGQDIFDVRSESPGFFDTILRLRRLKTVLIPSTRRPRRHYRATWSPNARTPEIALPVECPSEETDVWRETWKDAAGIDIPETESRVPDREMMRAVDFNKRLTSGRLADFRCDNRPIGETIFNDLTRAIEARYPDHREVPAEDDLQRELDQHEEFITDARQVFIEHGGVKNVLQALHEYVSGDDRRLFLLTADGGLGKSTLLAWWVDQLREQWKADPAATIHARFVGVGDCSANVDSLLEFLLRELKAAGKLEGELPDDPNKRRLKWAELLQVCGAKGRTLIVVDAINQLDSGLSDLGWLERPLPPNVKFLVSFKTGEPHADDILRRLRDDPNVCAQSVEPCTKMDDRKLLVNQYLGQYLKALDEKHVESLVDVAGAQNPLFLKVVLAELRIFGAHGLLGERIRRDFGEMPESAFDAALRRMESDPAYTEIEPRRAVTLLFGALAHARRGLPEDLLARLFVAELSLPDNPESRDAAVETIRLYLRQMRPFLARREKRHDFFYESFAIAARERYSKEANEWGCRPAASWHRSLAAVCENWETLDGPSRRYAIANLPYHLMEAGSDGDWKKLGKTLCNLRFIEAKVNHGMAFDLVRDFLDAEKRVPKPDLLGAGWIEWKQFVESEAGNLDRYSKDFPQLTFQQAYNQPKTGVVSRAAQGLRSSRKGPKVNWFERVNRQNDFARSACLKVLEGHTSSVHHVALTNDGRAVSASEDKTLRVWDLATGQCLQVLEGHISAVSHVALTNDDRAVSASADNNLRVWDLTTGQCLKELKGHGNQVYQVELTGDGRAVSVSLDKTLRVWDLATGQCLQVLALKGCADLIAHIVLTNDNHAISASGIYGNGNDNTVRVWDLATGQCLKVLEGHLGPVSHVALTGDSRAVSAGDKTLRMWDLTTGRCLKTLEGHTGGVKQVALTGDGRAVSASYDKTLRVWDMETGQCLKVLEGHTDWVVHVALTGDGRAVSASDDKTLRVWNLETGQCLKVLEGHKRWVRHVALTSDGHAVSASHDKTLRVWNLETEQYLTGLEGHTGDVRHVTLTGDGRAVSASDDHTLRIWDLASGRCLNVLEEHTWDVHYVALTGDGRAVSASWDRTLRVWDLATGRCLHVLKGHKCSVNHVAVTGDGRAVSAAGYQYQNSSKDSTLRVWDLATGQCLKVLEGHTDSVSRVALTCDGHAVSASKDGTLRVWDLTTGRCLKTLEGHTGGVKQVALTGDGRAVSASWDETLRVWDLATGQCLKVLEGHTDCVVHVALTGDGRAVSASDDKTLRVWNLETGRCIEVCLIGSYKAAVWRSSCLPEPDARDPHWQAAYGPLFFSSREMVPSIYPGQFTEGGGAPSGKYGICFSGGEPHILHLHGPGVDEPEGA